MTAICASIPFSVILVRSVSEDTRIQCIDVIVYGSSGRVPTGLAQGGQGGSGSSGRVPTGLAQG